MVNQAKDEWRVAADLLEERGLIQAAARLRQDAEETLLMHTTNTDGVIVLSVSAEPTDDNVCSIIRLGEQWQGPIVIPPGYYASMVMLRIGKQEASK